MQQQSLKKSDTNRKLSDADLRFCAVISDGFRQSVVYRHARSEADFREFLTTKYRYHIFLYVSLA
ncbi:hypothetical protein ISG33_04430 [Glaciecola sp. MH2013]|uniref:hypothetical protein n=1 Tax=Glaciecola sp. MH2013 TaxID=2785524 RepID=UPI0018A0A683|nr:hypothetical protein [Glaciecola sp. MH2013]MBF7072643.1 hypothetical protein [Glaciecola sp. MH2013]